MFNHVLLSVPPCLVGSLVTPFVKCYLVLIIGVFHHRCIEKWCLRTTPGVLNMIPTVHEVFDLNCVCGVICFAITNLSCCRFPAYAMDLGKFIPILFHPTPNMHVSSLSFRLFGLAWGSLSNHSPEPDHARIEPSG